MNQIHLKALEMVEHGVPDDKKHLIEDAKTALANMNPVIRKDPYLPGFQVGPMIDVESVKYVNNEWTPGKNDILVATFPKTGTTWTREIIRQLLFRNDEKLYKLSKACEMPVLGYIESITKLKFDIVKCFGMERTLWGTHLPGDVIDVDRLLKSGLKMIYVMRNPKDTLVSLKNFMVNSPGSKIPALKEYFPTDMEEFIRKTMKGETLIPTRLGEWYPHHIRSYYKYKDHPNVYFVKYEDLKKDPVAEIQKLANFIDVSLTEEELADVVNKTSFDNMKKNAGHGTKQTNMFRKGQAGNWKENISEQLSRDIDEKFAKDMEGMDINFTYSL